ncbi:MAG: DUF3793 family protein [Anaerocolumna sp.]
MSDDVFNMRGDKVTAYVIFTLANSCIPTLLRTKPACLVSFHKKYIDDQKSFLTVLKQEAEQFTCSYDVLYENENTYYVILYHTELLKDVLNTYCTNVILKENGYLMGNDKFYDNLLNFKTRFQSFKQNKFAEFPHEAGVFLGYPIIDVEEFIKNKGENYIFCGYWKVYHNMEEAGKTFDLFRKLREEAMELFYTGKELKEIVCLR